MEINTSTKGSNMTTHSTNAKNAFGESLRHARNQQRLDTKQIAADLYIKERQLIALEEEDFTALPQMTFARGFAVKYADYLGLDKEEIGKKFDNAYPDSLKVKRLEDIDAPIRPMGTLSRGNTHKFRINPILLVACVAVFILAVFLIRTVSSAEEEQSTPVVIEEGISTTEQRQGASLGTEAVGATGSAIHLDKKDKNNTNK